MILTAFLLQEGNSVLEDRAIKTVLWILLGRHLNLSQPCLSGEYSASLLLWLRIFFFFFPLGDNIPNWPDKAAAWDHGSDEAKLESEAGWATRKSAQSRAPSQLSNKVPEILSSVLRRSEQYNFLWEKGITFWPLLYPNSYACSSRGYPQSEFLNSCHLVR